MTEGVFARDEAFHAVAWPPAGVLEEVFRRLLLAALERAKRLTDEFASAAERPRPLPGGGEGA